MEPQGRAQQETIPKNLTPRSHRRQKKRDFTAKNSQLDPVRSLRDAQWGRKTWAVPYFGKSQSVPGAFPPPDLFLNRGPVTAGAGGGLDRGGDLGSDLGCYL